MLRFHLMKIPRARVIAFYLPQFHPIPENDEWWGRGFTEWTNVGKAQPVFSGHYQPHVPADLGFYDLRLPETRAAQAEMAQAHGIEAFCYWHYWFAGRRILERPFTEVLKSGEPKFPFCLAWANQTWSGIWHGDPDRILIEQTYPSAADHEAHFNVVLEAFGDERYVRVDGKPLFYVYRSLAIPEVSRFTDLWRNLAHRAGLPGLYLVAEGGNEWNPAKFGFDASVTVNLPSLQGWQPWWRPMQRLQWEWRKRRGIPTIVRFEDAEADIVPVRQPGIKSHPCLLPNWDNTPRSGRNGLVLHDSTPELFRRQVRRGIAIAESDPPEERLLFVKSWNEWAEGNHLEPDLKFGRGYLDVIREELQGDGPVQRSPTGRS
jgi:lipopolysaccharide biosynthesis protein